MSLYSNLFRYPISDTERKNLIFYINEINQIPRLSLEEEKELILDAKSGNKKSSDKLILSNLYLVPPFATYNSSKKNSVSDLISEGNFGLINSVNKLEKFDYNKSVRFSTYANWWIKQAIFRAIGKNSSFVCHPFNWNEKITKAMKYLDNGYSFEKVAEIFKWKESQLFEYLEEFSPKSLDVEFEDKNCTLLDKSNDTFRNFLIKYTRDEINSQLKDILSKKDLNIVEMKDSYAGINPSFEDIGNFLFISGERARQLYHRAEKKILKDKKLNEIIKSGVTL
jgi:RNA polymerase sigma factor (sigma-70 family)